jgi:hypothetical protein
MGHSKSRSTTPGSATTPSATGGGTTATPVVTPQGAR